MVIESFCTKGYIQWEKLKIKCNPWKALILRVNSGVYNRVHNQTISGSSKRVLLCYSMLFQSTREKIPRIFFFEGKTKRKEGYWFTKEIKMPTYYFFFASCRLLQAHSFISLSLSFFLGLLFFFFFCAWREEIHQRILN